MFDGAKPETCNDIAELELPRKVRYSFDIADTSGSFHTPDSRESNATISIGSDIESLAEEPNVRKIAQSHVYRRALLLLLLFSTTGYLP